MRTRSALVNFGWGASNAARYVRYRAALNRPEAAQRRLLASYLRDNAGTDFGRRHEFARLRSYADFRAAVPLSTYDDIAPYVDAIRAGRANVLTRDAVRRLVPSGGSTRAQKLIPYTWTLHDEFNAGIGPWIGDLFARRPGLMAGPAYWSVSPAAQPHVAAGQSAVPVGFDDDSAYVGGTWQRLIAAAFAVPSELRHAPSIEAFRYVTLLCLLCARDLRLISVWHPSFLTLLVDALPASFERLLKDVADGTCTPPDQLPSELAVAMRAFPQPKRSAELARIGATNTRALWPRLGLISCWADAHAALHVDGLRRRFRGVAIQPKGLIATEAFVSLPFAGLHPLAVRSHFLELLDNCGDAHLAHELSPGAEYRVVVTTGGGLYRYMLQDSVRVDGMVGRTPSIRFVGKDDHVSDHFGEKLSEGFVGEVLRRLFGRHRLRPPFAMLAPEARGGATGYALFVEGSEFPHTLSAELDEALADNPHYRYCRDLGQLAPARVMPLHCDGYAAYVAECRRRGQRLGDVKASPLSVHDGWGKVFADAAAVAPAPAAVSFDRPRR